MGARVKRIKGRIYTMYNEPGGKPWARAIGPDTPDVRERAERLVQQYRVAEASADGPSDLNARFAWKIECAERMLSNARSRARKMGLPFDLQIDNIIIPDRCPVLGMRLHSGKTTDGGFNYKYAPSLDRLNPSLGYVVGNVMVISWLANAIRSNHSAEHLRKVADWVAFVEQHSDHEKEES